MSSIENKLDKLYPQMKNPMFFIVFLHKFLRKKCFQYAVISQFPLINSTTIDCFTCRYYNVIGTMVWSLSGLFDWEYYVYSFLLVYQK